MLLCNHRSNGASHSTHRATCGDLQAALFYALKGGERVSVTCEIKDYNLLKKQLDKMQAAPEKVMKSLMGDVRKRVPPWIAAEVSKQYGIKKAEITSNAVGTVKVKGDDVRSAEIIYKGRVLTPTHFGMSPKAPGQNAYTLKATIIKGQRTTLGKVKKMTKKQRAALAKNFTRSGTRSSDHSPIMLMRTGNTYIPFQRKSARRNDVEAIKTISLPQMVSSERAAPGIQQAINEGLGKRLDHYVERYMGK